jgi:hypothetical protein
VTDCSSYSNNALRHFHAECKEQYFSLHARVRRMETQRQRNTPEYAQVTAEAKRQFNVMVDIEREGERRGLVLTH